MLAHTKSYRVLRQHSQQMLDFAVLVCTAAPQLEYDLNQSGAGTSTYLATNPVFRASNQPYATEKRALPDHQAVLGATLVLSMHAYFETYFFSVIDEILEFHGGAAGIEAAIMKQLSPRQHPAAVSNALSYLRTVFKPKRVDQYRNHTNTIMNNNFTWPSQRFMLFGLKQALRDRKRWRAWQIPDLALELLTFPVTDAERSAYNDLRDKRNEIAHGKVLQFNIQEALEINRFIIEFAKRIEVHVVSNCMVIERFAH